ncbi:MAG TPA: type II toxin-antitoxin system prevent-host-death family antitoxin [Actinomycetota bacterium]|nr:type II toxin-antitoxin system prevent-host-death family antitoxin [Actinomycetota bacterium]
MSISEFKATCLAALERVRKTREPLLVTKRGKPIAQIVPPPVDETTSWYGIMPGVELEDIVEPLPREAWGRLG